MVMDSPAPRVEREVRLASMPVLLVGVAASYLLVLALNLWLFSSELLRGLTRASAGWINVNLPFFLLMSAASLPILFAWGRLRPADVGLIRSQWKTGLAVLVALWSAIQLFSLVAGSGFDLHPAWSDPGTGYVLGLLLAMLLGTALYEEVFFRGFLLQQLYLRFERIGSERGRLLLAILVSALVFSPWHLPTLLINQDLEPVALLMRLLSLLGAGLLLALLYLRTGNLWVTMAVHALVNAPTLLFAAPVAGSMIAGTLGVVLIVIWPWFSGRRLATPLLRFRAAPERR